MKGFGYKVVFCLFVAIFLVLTTMLVSSRADAEDTYYYYYRDSDGDGYGNPVATIKSLEPTPPEGYVTDNTDCDEGDPTVHSDQTLWYQDCDNDGYSDGTFWTGCHTIPCPTNPSVNYKLASELIATSGDCDDTNPKVHSDQTLWYQDCDNDGYSNGISIPGCFTALCPTNPSVNLKLASELIAISVDCDDTNPKVHSDQTLWYQDCDNDGYSNGISIPGCFTAPCPTNPSVNLKLADELITTSGDCDDTNPNLHLSCPEICDDGIDNDGDGEDSVTPAIYTDTIAAFGDVIPVSTGQANISFAFTDSNSNDTHSVSFDWGDGNKSVVNPYQGIRTVEDTHVYTQVGVYSVTLTVTDNYCGSDSAEYRYIVVYDPNGGFITGGGWINSPEGAYVSNPSLIGKANFGFVSKYKKGATVPTGNTEFQFQVANLNFHSESYDWLVIAGAKAQYKGVGTINGTGEYKFILTAIDGQVKGGGGTDKFRIKIWDKLTGTTIYDNMLDTADNADPTTVIAGGSIVIHKQ